MPAKPNIKTVAQAAGVSPASVSNAYNRPERLSHPVRERILAVAQDLGYAGPDPAAHSLRAGRAAAVGVLFSTGLSYAFSDPYCVELLHGVSLEAERARMSLVLMPIVPHTAALDEEETRQSVAAVRRAVIDGAIVDGIEEHHPALAVLRARGIPLVCSVEYPDALCVLVDDRAGGRLVGEHLATLGHRDVAVLVDAPAGTRALEPANMFPYARLRLDGIREGLGPEARVTVVVAGPNNVGSGREAAAELLAAERPPTAIAAVSDVVALGVLEAARGHGVAVTGFDDIPAATAAGLTTVRQPILEKGRLMGRMLLDPDFTDRRVVLPLELVPRATSIPRERSEQ